MVGVMRKLVRSVIGGLLYTALVLAVLSAYYVSVMIWWNNQYDRESFNCVDMSYRLAPLFHNLGFDTEIVYGNNDEVGHCWLSLDGVYFDATVLWFNDESDYPNVTFVDRYPFGVYDDIERSRMAQE